MGALKTIIDTTVDEFRNKFTAVNGYIEPVKVFDVLMDPSNVKQYPSLAIGMHFNEVHEEGNMQMRRLPQIMVYGYVNKKDQLFDLAEDVEHFLYNSNSDFTYKSAVQPIYGSGVNFRYSGTSSSTGVFTFDLLFGIFYQQDLSI